MSVINKISNLLKYNKTKTFSDDEKLQKGLLLNYTLIIIAFFSLLFGILHFFLFEKEISYYLFSYFVTFSILFFIYRINQNHKLCPSISLFFITLLYLQIIYVGAGDNTAIVIGLTYPVAVSIAFGYKKGNLFSLLFFAATLIIFFVPLSLWAQYSLNIKMRYSSAYIGILFVLQYYLRIQQQIKNNYEKRIIEAQRKLDEKDNLLAKLSYQIRTPLDNIAGITNLNHDILKKETIEEIEISISNLITLVNSISSFTDNKAIQIKGKKSSFNINNTIKKSVSLFHSDKYTNLKCSLSLSGEVTENVFGDRLIFVQTILAAIDFLYNNKKNKNTIIELVSNNNEDDNSFSLEISSNSHISFLKEYTDKKQIVNIEKLNNNEVRIIKGLVGALNSKFKLFSYNGKTSFIFNFKFSLKEGNKENNINEEKITMNGTKIPKKLNDATILLVEDDAINSKIMSLNLKKFVNKVIIAENGKEALDKFARTKVDLILMDIKMPLMNGYKATEKIRKTEAATGFKVPIIAVTANVSIETKKRVFEVGMNDYTTKPVNFKILLKKMEALLN